ncbi:hypothetical protein GCM10010420_47840 [Streptomyces glaucosporus]|uniref:RHS protein conserved region domain-containing protein n=1 Tax=Streptomyces glaucosporus TaxID=284044 RepID=A0ABN3IUK8_9ACTN
MSHQRKTAPSCDLSLCADSAVPGTEIDARFFAIVTDLVGTPAELVDDTGRIAWHTRSTP